MLLHVLSATLVKRRSNQANYEALRYLVEGVRTGTYHINEQNILRLTCGVDAPYCGSE